MNELFKLTSNLASRAEESVGEKDGGEFAKEGFMNRKMS